MVLKMVAVVIVLPLLSGGVDAMEHVDHVHVDALHGFPVKKQQRFRANGEIVTYEQPVVLELRTRSREAWIQRDPDSKSYYKGENVTSAKK